MGLIKKKFYDIYKENGNLNESCDKLRDWIEDRSGFSNEIKTSLIWGFQYDSGSKIAPTRSDCNKRYYNKLSMLYKKLNMFLVV